MGLTKKEQVLLQKAFEYTLFATYALFVVSIVFSMCTFIHSSSGVLYAKQIDIEMDFSIPVKILVNNCIVLLVIILISFFKSTLILNCFVGFSIIIWSYYFAEFFKNIIYHTTVLGTIYLVPQEMNQSSDDSDNSNYAPIQTVLPNIYANDPFIFMFPSKCCYY